MKNKIVILALGLSIMCAISACGKQQPVSDNTSVQEEINTQEKTEAEEQVAAEELTAVEETNATNEQDAAETATEAETTDSSTAENGEMTYSNLEEYYTYKVNYEKMKAQIQSMYDNSNGIYSGITWSIDNNEIAYKYIFANEIENVEESEDAIKESYANAPVEQWAAIRAAIIDNSKITDPIIVRFEYYQPNGDFITDFSVQLEE